MITESIHRGAARRRRVHFNKGLAQRGIIAATISFGFMLVFAIVSAVLLTQNFIHIVEEHLLGSTPELEQLIGSDAAVYGSEMVMMFAHAIGATLDPTAQSTTSVTVNPGIALFVLLPMLALFVGGWINAQIHRYDSIVTKIKTSFTTGVTYALLLGIATFVINGSADVATVDAHVHFSFFQALLNGFLLGVLFSFLGSLFQTRLFHTTSLLRNKIFFGEAIHQVFFTVAKGLIAGTIMAILAVLLAGDHLPSKNLIAILIIIAQLGAYFFNIFSFSALRMEIGGLSFLDDAPEDATLSLYSATSLSDGAAFFFYPGTLLMMAFIVYAAYKIKRVAFGNVWRYLGVFSIGYALLSTVVSYFASIRVHMGGNHAFLPSVMDLSIGTYPVGTFFLSFLFCAVVSVLTVLLFGKKGSFSAKFGQPFDT